MKRNLALDMLRALTMMLMVFVNDFWKVHDVPQWMLHQKYGVDFLGLSDYVLPMFLFCVGMSIPYAIESRFRKGFSTESTIGHILVRSLSLMIMGSFLGNSEARIPGTELRLPLDFTLYPIGAYWILSVVGFLLVWNAYPKDPTRKQKWLFASLKIVGGCILLLFALTYRSPQGGVFQFRPSILGGIAWTYLFGAVTYLLTRDNLKKIMIVWGSMFLLLFLTSPMRPEMGSMAIIPFQSPNFVDGLMRTMHVGTGTFMGFGGLVLTVVVEKSADWKESKKIIVGMCSALILFIAACLLRKLWIASKLGITLPCVFYIYSLGVFVYTILRTLCRHNITKWFKVIAPAGAGTLTVYMMPYVYYGFAEITGYVLPDWFTHGPMALVNCFCFSLVCIWTAGLLRKFKISLKV